MRLSILAVLAASVSSAFAQALDKPTNTIWENIMAYNQNEDGAGGDADNTYHISMVNKFGADVKDILSGPGPFTFFAPSDHSFLRLQQSNPSYYQQLTTDGSLMKATLQYLITEGVYDITNPGAAHKDLPSYLAGNTVSVTIEANTAADPAGWVKCAVKSSADPDTPAYTVHTMPSSNGILYVIYTVLDPPQSAISAAGSNAVAVPVHTASAPAHASATATTEVTTHPVPVPTVAVSTVVSKVASSTSVLVKPSHLPVVNGTRSNSSSSTGSEPTGAPVTPPARSSAARVVAGLAVAAVSAVFVLAL
ncbi:hypothetical protein HKX48_001383 [Thoreauomyces humboldtii]|nr:hypothetical protein HKX48_001383 [Thoreauomyces humboldtii]